MRKKRVMKMAEESGGRMWRKEEEEAGGGRRWRKEVEEGGGGKLYNQPLNAK